MQFLKNLFISVDLEPEQENKEKIEKKYHTPIFIYEFNNELSKMWTEITSSNVLCETKMKNFLQLFSKIYYNQENTCEYHTNGHSTTFLNQLITLFQHFTIKIDQKLLFFFKNNNISYEINDFLEIFDIIIIILCYNYNRSILIKTNLLNRIVKLIKIINNRITTYKDININIFIYDYMLILMLKSYDIILSFSSDIIDDNITGEIVLILSYSLNNIISYDNNNNMKNNNMKNNNMKNNNIRYNLLLKLLKLVENYINNNNFTEIFINNNIFNILFNLIGWKSNIILSQGIAFESELELFYQKEYEIQHNSIILYMKLYNNNISYDGMFERMMDMILMITYCYHNVTEDNNIFDESVYIYNDDDNEILDINLDTFTCYNDIILNLDIRILYNNDYIQRILTIFYEKIISNVEDVFVIKNIINLMLNVFNKGVCQSNNNRKVRNFLQNNIPILQLHILNFFNKLVKKDSNIVVILRTSNLFSVLFGEFFFFFESENVSNKIINHLKYNVMYLIQNICTHNNIKNIDDECKYLLAVLEYHSNKYDCIINVCRCIISLLRCRIIRTQNALININTLEIISRIIYNQQELNKEDDYSHDKCFIDSRIAVLRLFEYILKTNYMKSIALKQNYIIKTIFSFLEEEDIYVNFGVKIIKSLLLLQGELYKSNIISYHNSSYDSPSVPRHNRSNSITSIFSVDDEESLNQNDNIIFLYFVELIPRFSKNFKIIKILLEIIRFICDNRKYHQICFKNNHCFIQIVNLLNFYESSKFSHSVVVEMIVYVLKTISSLMHQNLSNRRYFRDTVGYIQLKDIILSLCSNVDEVIFDNLFDMLVDGEFDFQNKYFIQNHHVINLIFNLIPFCENNLQLILLTKFTALVNNSVLNQSYCCRSDLLDIVLDHFESGGDVNIRHKYVELMEILGSYSINVKQLKRFFSLMKPKIVDGKEIMQSHTPRLLHALRQMHLGDMPLSFFFFDGKNSGLSINTIKQWPKHRGYTFTTWIFIESFYSESENYQPRLLQFLTFDNCGVDVFFDQNRLSMIVKLHSKRISRLIIPYIFKKHCWYHIGISHSTSRTFSNSSLSFYVNGVCEYYLDSFPYPNTNSPCINNNIGTDGYNNTFCGSFGAIYIFDHVLSKEDIVGIYHLGSSYCYNFQHSDLSSFPSQCHEILQNNLDSKIFLCFNSKTIEKNDTFLDNTPELNFNRAASHHNMNALRLTGTHQCLAYDVKNSLECLGGVKLLFLLFGQLDLPIPIEESNYHYNNPETLLVEIFLTLTDMITDNASHQSFMCESRGLYVLSYLLEECVHKKYINVETLESILRLVSCVDSDNPFFIQAFLELIFNFRIWIYVAFNVQKEWLLSLYKMIAANPKFFREKITIQVVLDRLRDVCYFTPDENSQCIPVLIYDHDNNIVGKRPSYDDMIIIRQGILSLIKTMLNGSSMNYKETRSIVRFLYDCQDKQQIKDVLSLLVEIMSENDEIYVHIKALGGSSIFLYLLNFEQEDLRILALTALCYLWSSFIISINEQKKLLPLIHHSLLPYQLNHRIYGVIFPIIIGSDTQNTNLIVDNSNIQIKHPALLMTLMELLPNSKNIELIQLILQNIFLFSTQYNNRMVIINCFGWQTWFFNLILKISIHNNDSSHVVRDIVLNTLTTIIFSELKVYRGYDTFQKTIAFLSIISQNNVGLKTFNIITGILRDLFLLVKREYDNKKINTTKLLENFQKVLEYSEEFLFYKLMQYSSNSSILSSDNSNNEIIQLSKSEHSWLNIHHNKKWLKNTTNFGLIQSEMRNTWNFVNIIIKINNWLDISKNKLKDNIYTLGIILKVLNTGSFYTLIELLYSNNISTLLETLFTDSETLICFPSSIETIDNNDEILFDSDIDDNDTLMGTSSLLSCLPLNQIEFLMIFCSIMHSILLQISYNYYFYNHSSHLSNTNVSEIKSSLSSTLLFFRSLMLSSYTSISSFIYTIDSEIFFPIDHDFLLQNPSDNDEWILKWGEFFTNDTIAKNILNHLNSFCSNKKDEMFKNILNQSLEYEKFCNLLENNFEHYSCQQIEKQIEMKNISDYNQSLYSQQEIGRRHLANLRRLRMNKICSHGWLEMSREITNERSPWQKVNTERIYWCLDPTENKSRMRRKLRINYNGTDHKDSSISTTKTKSKKQKNKNVNENTDISGKILNKLLSDIKGTSAESDEKIRQTLEDPDPEWSILSNREDDIEYKNQLPLASGYENVIVFHLECGMVTPLNVINGDLTLTRSNLYFFAGNDAVALQNDCIKSNKRLTLGIKDFKWSLSDMTQVHFRLHQLSHNSLEIFFVDCTNFFFRFKTKKMRNKFYNTLFRLSPNNVKIWNAKSPPQVLKSSGYTELWQSGRLSNFDYLMLLNTIAGRTYNDLTQYPVFPWILADYSSDTVDLNDTKVYRDLSKPIGALNENRLKQCIERYNSFEQDMNIPPFHYGTHYSGTGIVLFYLIRQEPFTTLALELQDGKFDHADRLFDGIASTWSGVMTNQADVKELIPEFFYFPEFLRNHNDFDLGIKQNSEVVDDVILPPWASSPEEFVRINREALESEYVSDHLNEWIDLIFGYKQRGSDAVKAFNVFHYLTYEGTVNIDLITDEVERIATISQIDNFGQTPTQLLKHPHPKRYKEKTLLPLFSRIDQKEDDGICYYISYQISESMLIFISNVPNYVITMDSNRILGVHIWKQTLVDCNPPFKIEIQKKSSECCIIGTHFSHLIPDVLKSTTLFACDPNGKYLLSCGYWDCTFKVTNLENGSIVQSIGNHKDVVTCIVIDDYMIATGSKDTTVILWNILKKKNIFVDTNYHKILYGHDNEVLCVTLDIDLDICISGSKDNTIIIHSVQKGIYIRTITPCITGIKNFLSDLVGIHLVAVSSQGNILVYSFFDQFLHIFTVNGQLLCSVDSYERLYCVLFSEDGRYLITGGNRCVVTIRRVHDLKIVKKLRNHIDKKIENIEMYPEYSICSLEWSENEHHLFVC